jgi:hypothetical protein
MEKRRISSFVAGMVAVVLGALMIAEGTLGWVTGQSLFYPGVNPTFKFVVGFLVVVLAAPLLDRE